MTGLIDTLTERRERLASRGRRLAAATWGQGLEALGKVRDGALDWHRTLEARRAKVDAGGSRPRWPRLDGLQVFVLDRLDRVLVAFAERVREEVARLSRIEIAPTDPAGGRAPAPAATGEPSPKARPDEVAKKKPASRASRRLVMPIAGYDEMTAKEILAEIGGLSTAQCRKLRAHEAATKKRKTVLRALDARLGRA